MTDLKRNKGNNPINNHKKKKKVWRINLTGTGKDIYDKNFQTLKKKIRKTLEDRKTSHVYELEELMWK